LETIAGSGFATVVNRRLTGPTYRPSRAAIGEPRLHAARRKIMVNGKLTMMKKF
jgi:hypothetical protein